MTTRKKYPREFKLDAIHLMRKQGYTGVEAARSLDVNVNMPGRWITGHEAHDRGVSRQWQPEVA